MKISIIGSGSWGTALAKTLFDKKQHELYWWIRQQKNYEYIVRYGRNARYLRSVDIDLKPKFLSTDIKYVVAESEIVFICVPSIYIRQILSDLQADLLKNKIIVSTTKGLLTHNNQLISTFLNEQYGVNPENFVFLTGPSHAEEVVNNMSTYLTIASHSEENANKIGDSIQTEFIKYRISHDVNGLQYSSVLKNIYAIASGLCHSLGYGDNFVSVLVSNAIRETNKMVESCCPCQRDIMSSGYLGDLMVTCFSQFSRNRTFGEMIGRGYSVQAALLELKMIPEGYYALKSCFKIARELNIDMKILQALYSILYDNEDPQRMIEKLEKELD